VVITALIPKVDAFTVLLLVCISKESTEYFLQKYSLPSK
jgi:hypothetical protein